MLAVILSALVAGQPAQAPDPPPLGSRIYRKARPVEKSEEGGVKVMHLFAACVAKTQKTGAKYLLTTEIGSADQSRAVNRLVGGNSRCLGLYAAKMSLSQTLFRGAIAEALYKQQFRQLPISAPASLVKSVEDVRGEASLVLGAFARCVVSRKAGGVDALLRTTAASSDEEVAIGALKDIFDPCALERQTIEIDALTLRAALAEALYVAVKQAEVRS
jgi:hypothetical protein